MEDKDVTMEEGPSGEERRVGEEDSEMKREAMKKRSS